MNEHNIDKIDENISSIENDELSDENTSAIKKLTAFTIFIVIAGITAAGTWYKKDDIQASEFYTTSENVYNESIETISNNYNAIASSLLGHEVVIQKDPTQSEAEIVVSNEDDIITITDTTEDIGDIKTAATIEQKEISIVEAPEALVLSAATVNEKPARLSVTPEVITPSNTVIVTEEEIAEELAILDIPVAKDAVDTDIVIADKSVKLTAEAIENTVVIEETQTIEVTEVIETPRATEPVKAITKPTLVNQTYRAPYPASRTYAFAPAPYRFAPQAPYGFNAPVQNMPYNTMSRSNTMMQQPRSFEDNMRMQQQMMQQALKMQTTIFRDADKRHKEMLQRVANWNAQAKQRREQMNARYQRPAYMN